MKVKAKDYELEATKEELEWAGSLVPKGWHWFWCLVGQHSYIHPTNERRKERRKAGLMDGSVTVLAGPYHCKHCGKERPGEPDMHVILGGVQQRRSVYRRLKAHLRRTWRVYVVAAIIGGIVALSWPGTAQQTDRLLGTFTQQEIREMKRAEYAAGRSKPMPFHECMALLELVAVDNAVRISDVPMRGTYRLVRVPMREGWFDVSCMKRGKHERIAIDRSYV